MSGLCVMINGLRGRMGQEILAVCSGRGMALSPFALEGPGCPDSIEVSLPSGNATVALAQPGDAARKALESAKADAASRGLTLIAIDFTHPTAVNGNCDLYSALQVPFVLGTTGGDREALMRVVKTSGVRAVIAPNMCKQIVALQAMLKSMAEQFPGSFDGYSLHVKESHQTKKADTSGTAKAFVAHWNDLRGKEEKPLEHKDIIKVRSKEEQRELGVPEDALGGHAWHTYTLTSSDGSTQFALTHNICGRRTYAEGVADAVAFLSGKIAAASEQRLFDMIDVLKEGAMS